MIMLIKQIKLIENYYINPMTSYNGGLSATGAPGYALIWWDE